MEDCALVFKEIARPDERDASVLDIPFNWDVDFDATQLRVAYFPETFEDDPGKEADWAANDRRTLDQLRGLGILIDTHGRAITGLLD